MLCTEESKFENIFCVNLNVIFALLNSKNYFLALSNLLNPKGHICSQTLMVYHKTNLFTKRLIFVSDYVAYIPEMFQNQPMTFSCAQYIYS